MTDEAQREDTGTDPKIRAPIRRRERSQHEFYQSLSGSMPFAWGTIAMAGISAAIYAAMVGSGVHAIDPTVEDLLAWGADYGPTTTSGEWWRLLSSAFVHIGFVHLALNVWCLLDVGTFLERLLGHGPLLVIYLFSAIVGAVTSLAWQPLAVSAGASGAVFGVLGGGFACFTALRRAIPPSAFHEHRNSAIVFVLYNVAIGLTSPMIDNAAHVGGFVGGFLATKLLCRAAVVAEPPRPPLMNFRWALSPTLVGIIAVGVAVAFVRTESLPAVQLQKLSEEWAQAEAAGDDESVLAAIDRAVEIEPSNWTWHFNRTHYLEKLGRFPEALAAIEKAIQLQPYGADLHNYRGWILGCLDRHEEALLDLDRAISIDDQCMLAHYNKADFLCELERYEEALAAADRAVSVDADNPDFHSWRAFALRNLDRVPEARAALERALKCDPNHEWAQEELAQLPREQR